MLWPIIPYVLWKRQTTLHEGRRGHSTPRGGEATRKWLRSADGRDIQAAVHRRRAMTTLPSLITHPVNSGPCPCLSDGFHLGVVSSSQAQPPASIASMLLRQDSARRQLVARLKQDPLLFPPRLLVVEHQRQPAAQLQALGPLGHHARGDLALHLDRPQLAARVNARSGSARARQGSSAAARRPPARSRSRSRPRPGDAPPPGSRCRGSPTCAAAPRPRSPTRPAPGRKRPGTTADPWG